MKSGFFKLVTYADCANMLIPLDGTSPVNYCVHYIMMDDVATTMIRVLVALGAQFTDEDKALARQLNRDRVANAM